MNELEHRCKKMIVDAGIDGRTCYFAGILGRNGSSVHQLQDATQLSPKDIERILAGFVSERYAHYHNRRAHGLETDREAINLILSQGYKRGQSWRGIPLGKTRWDVCIYQQLLQELQPKVVIEFGTGLGGSALFFYDHCRMFGLDTEVLTLDINGRDVSQKLTSQTGIEFIEGDINNLAELLPAERLKRLPHPWLIVEDCHHLIPTTIRHLFPNMESGDYLIVEDIGLSAAASAQISTALHDVPNGALMVDTFYTDMFGRNVTCSPDSIFRRM